MTDWLHGFNYNVEEWFEGDRHETRRSGLARAASSEGGLVGGSITRGASLSSSRPLAA
jgi:hypothetical protein